MPRWAQAIKEYRTALRLDPNDGDTHNNLGVALERNGDLRAALEEYRKACTLDPKDATYESNFRRLSQQVDK